MLGFARILGVVAVVAGILPVVLGTIRFRARTHAEISMWMWVSMIAVLNVVTVALTLLGFRTAHWINATIPLLLVTGLRALRCQADSERARRLSSIVAACYVALWAWQQTSPRPAFAYILGPSAWFLLSVAAAGTIIARLHRIEAGGLHDFGVVSGLAVLVTYAPLATLEAVSAGIVSTSPRLVLLLWTSRIGLAILGSLLFALAFLWTIPCRSLYGSSSSVR